MYSWTISGSHVFHCFSDWAAASWLQSGAFSSSEARSACVFFREKNIVIDSCWLSFYFWAKRSLYTDMPPSIILENCKGRLIKTSHSWVARWCSVAIRSMVDRRPCVSPSSSSLSTLVSSSLSSSLGGFVISARSASVSWCASASIEAITSCGVSGVLQCSSFCADNVRIQRNVFFLQSIIHKTNADSILTMFLLLTVVTLYPFCIFIEIYCCCRLYIILLLLRGTNGWFLNSVMSTCSRIAFTFL